jgi:hypothetical protein
MLGAKKMWSNFSAMPGLLKFLTAHALGMSVLLVASVVPHDSFVMYGQPVSYAEWWRSGAGPFASLLGIILPISAIFFLRRDSRGRIIYLASLSIAMIVPYFIHRKPASAAIGVLLVTFGIWYLYRKATVVAYFTTSLRDPS